MRLVSDPRPDHHRFRAIYRDEFGFVWAVARRFGVPPAALDDAVQDVFLTAFRRLDRLGYQVSQRAWLYAVTRKVAAHHRRRAARSARRLAALEQVGAAPAEVPQERHHAAEILEHLLAPLPRGTREVWELTELLGMTGPEIAAELELPLNTVYSRLRLARAQLSARAEAVTACITAARERDAPPPEAAQRGWAVLLPMLRPASFVGLAAGWAGARAAIAGTMIVVAGVVLTAGGSPVAAPPASVAHEPTPTTAPSAVVIPTRPAAPTARPRRAAATSADRLAAEVAMIDAARAADTPAVALALLARHAREFPDGALHDAREAARVEATCRLGDPAGADAIARALVADHTDSLLARKYEHYACAP